MKKLLLAVAILLTFAGNGLSQERIIFDNTANGGFQNQDVKPAFPLPVVSSGKVAGALTYTKTTVSLNGSSQTMLAAAAGRGAMHVYNPTANASVYIDIAGGTVASETGIKIPAGTWYAIVGSSTPTGIITVIGTNTQSLLVWEGK